jgi:O-antigen ligase
VLPLLLFGLLYIDDYMMQNNEYYASTQENTIKRFQEEGVESNRFLQWSSALDIILDNPLGGSSTDKSIEKTHWFHNLWLDIGRTSGILPIILILIPQLYIFYLLVFSLIKKPNFEKHFLFIFYIALLIALFVEIALEGNIVLFVFHVFFIAVIFRYFRLENKTLEGEKLVCK